MTTCQRESPLGMSSQTDDQKNQMREAGRERLRDTFSVCTVNLSFYFCHRLFYYFSSESSPWCVTCLMSDKIGQPLPAGHVSDKFSPLPQRAQTHGWKRGALLSRVTGSLPSERTLSLQIWNHLTHFYNHGVAKTSITFKLVPFWVHLWLLTIEEQLLPAKNVTK